MHGQMDKLPGAEKCPIDKRRRLVEEGCENLFYLFYLPNRNLSQVTTAIKVASNEGNADLDFRTGSPDMGS
jgi:hypothetical protein